MVKLDMGMVLSTMVRLGTMLRMDIMVKLDMGVVLNSMIGRLVTMQVC